MNDATKSLYSMVLCCAISAAATAQQAPAPASNGPDASATPGATAPPAGKPAKATAQSEAGEPRADTRSNSGAAGPGSGQKPGSKIDRLDLGTATVTGDREQPKVMYIVPWKKSDIGDLAGKPMNSLVDEILAPVDRDVFKREVVYYHAVQDVASQNGAPPKPAQQGEK